MHSPQHHWLQLSQAGSGRIQTGVTTEPRPASISIAIQVLRDPVRVTKEGRKTRVAHSRQIVDERPPLSKDGDLLEIGEDGLSTNSVEFDVATGGQEREPVLELNRNAAVPGIEESAVPTIKAKTAVLLTDQIDNCEATFVGRQAQTPA